MATGITDPTPSDFEYKPIGSEGLTRDLLDRSIDKVDGKFTEQLGVGNSPLYAAVQTVQARGSTAVADIGCGTGNTLCTAGERIQELTGCPPEAVHLTGVSLEDYSSDSQNPDTLAALKGTEASPPLVNYVIDDATHMSKIPTASQDIVYSYNAMIRTAQPEGWLVEMLRITRPGGTLFFNARPRQLSNDLITRLRASGHAVVSNELLSSPNSFPPGEGEHRFYRVDVPLWGITE